MKRHSRITTKTVLIIISVVCILSMVLTFETRTRTSYIEQSVTSVIIPFQKGVTYFGDWIRARVEFLTNIKELDKINEDLLKLSIRLNFYILSCLTFKPLAVA